MENDTNCFGFDDSLDDLFSADNESLFNTAGLEEHLEPQNPYLQNPKEGLELISSLLHLNEETKSQLRKINRLDHLIDERLLQSINKIQLKNEVVLYESLVKLSDKLFEQNKMKLLKQKTTIGIGGQFSAGKSKFINSILGEEILPEDQVPTTSIATYLVKGSDIFIEAYTKNDRTVPLTMDAVKALSHEFYSTYNLGFSQFINNLVISTPTFPYESIALLDTPGYSKSDSTKKRALSDNEKALNQLKTVDYLIWLIDVENGVIKQADIDFIESLGLKTPILIVFNKADKKIDSQLQEIVINTRDQIKQTNIPLYEVVAYSSQEGKEYLKRNYLKAFFNKVNQKSKENVEIEQEIINIIGQLERQIDQYEQNFKEERNEISNFIFHSQDIAEVKTLTEVYATILQELRDIHMCKRNLIHTKKQIVKQFDLLKSGGSR
ncbi:dynamin family protein [Paenisporosarcina sp.]|uniref:dynamin family protein n=1 Tax=Paenisporosarcina sp. TaxID=1932001 RepID=UPI003C759CC7